MALQLPPSQSMAEAGLATSEAVQPAPVPATILLESPTTIRSSQAALIRRFRPLTMRPLKALSINHSPRSKVFKRHYPTDSLHGVGVLLFLVSLGLLTLLVLLLWTTVGATVGVFAGLIGIVALLLVSGDLLG